MKTNVILPIVCVVHAPSLCAATLQAVWRYGGESYLLYVIPGHQQTKQPYRRRMDMNDRNGWKGKEHMSHPTWQTKAEGSELGGSLKIFRSAIFIISVYDGRMEVCHFRLLNASSPV